MRNGKWEMRNGKWERRYGEMEMAMQGSGEL